MLSKIGKYEIVGEIGHGGFGRVYKARDPNFAHTVAIKLFSAEADPGLLARFRSEAATTANLRHANIVTVHDFGDENGIPYIVMEYLEGNTLRAVANGTVKLTIAEKVRVLLKAAAGLQYAHERGIVHRDVKLENIMLLNDGSVKLMDFGIARFLNDEGTRVTIEGSLVGTLKYMAPEQFHQTEADQLTDIFSFGVVEYEVLAGRHPFPGTNEGAVLHQLLTVDPVPISELISGCPERLSDAVAKALSKQRDQRFQSMEDLRFENQAAVADLEKQEARSLTVEAEELLSEGDLDGAKLKVRRALDMDATSELSHKLRRRIEEEARSREVRPRVNSLLERGDGLLAERQIPEAIRAFQDALSLDRQNTQVKDRLHKAQEALARAKRTAQLVEAATRDLEHNNLTAAFQRASEGLDEDPANRDLLDVLARVRKIQDQRTRAVAIQAAINQARGLLLAREFEHALGILTATDAQHGSSPLLEELKDQIQLELARDRRNKELEACLKQSREWIRGAQFAEAERTLSEMKDRFPESVELRQLLQFAQEQVEAERQKQQIERTGSKIRTALDQHDLVAAEELLESISSYTDETRVQELAATVAKARRHAEREHAIRVACLDAETLLQSDNFDEARNKVQACLKGGEDPRLLSLSHKIEEAHATWQRNASIAAAAEQAVEMTRMMSFGEATQIIGRAIQQYGSDKRLSAAHKEILSLEAEWKAAEANRVALEEGRACVQKGDFPGAYAAASKFSDDYRQSEDGRKFLAEIKAQEELAAANRKVDAAEKLLEQTKLFDAQQLLTSVLLAHPDLDSAKVLHGRLKEAEEAAREQELREKALEELRKKELQELAREREAAESRKRDEQAREAAEEQARQREAEAARQRAIEEARQRKAQEEAREREAEQTRQLEIEAERKRKVAEEELKAKQAREAAEARQAEEARQTEAEAQRKRQEEARKREAEDTRKREAEAERKRQAESEGQRKSATEKAAAEKTTAAKAAEDERKAKDERKARQAREAEEARKKKSPQAALVVPPNAVPPNAAAPDMGDGATQIFSSPGAAQVPQPLQEAAKLAPPPSKKSVDAPPLAKQVAASKPKLAPLPPAVEPAAASSVAGPKNYAVSGAIAAGLLVAGLGIWYAMGSKPAPTTSVASVNPVQTAPANVDPVGTTESPKVPDNPTTSPTTNNPTKAGVGAVEKSLDKGQTSNPKDPTGVKPKFPPLPPFTGDAGKGNGKADGGDARRVGNGGDQPVAPHIDAGTPPVVTKLAGNNPPPPPPPPGPARRLLSYEQYGGSKQEDVRWNGELAPGDTLTITSGGSRGGTTSKSFPNTKFRVQITFPPNIAVVESPGEGNGWDRLVLRNTSVEPISRIQYTWTVIR